MSELKIILEGLDCAHCASKIEAQVKKLENISEASLNFISKTLTIEHSSDDKQIFETVEKIVHKLEPDVKVFMDEEDEHVHDEVHDHSHQHESLVCNCGHDHEHEHVHAEHSNSHSACCCGDDHSHDEDHWDDGHNHNKKGEVSSQNNAPKKQDHGHSHEHNSEKKTLIRLLIAALLFIHAVIF